jgi:hypothetical protein
LAWALDGNGGAKTPPPPKGGLGTLAQEASSAAVAIMEIKRPEGRERPRTVADLKGNVMSLLLLEALGALVLLVFIVWWTMFSGRKNGELKDDPPAAD